MEEVFISEFFELDDELEELGVFDSIINIDSKFFINILRLKQSEIVEFKDSYNRINEFFRTIMILLDTSNAKGDKMYRAALEKFTFPGVKGINLGVSETGMDAGFGPILSQQVISDAFDIVKAGSKQPEIFQLVGLFEKNVSSDRLSDMIATIILPDIKRYTREINRKLGLNNRKYTNVEFEDEIAINPFKKCELLYLPKEILHEIPIARSWSDIDRVIAENKAIRDEVNDAIGKEWKKMCTTDKKEYMKNHIFNNAERCERLIDSYRQSEINEYELANNWDYMISDTFKQMKKSGLFNFLEHSDNSEIDSWQASMKVLSILKDWVENNKGWDEILSSSTTRREKSMQRLLHLCGKYYCTTNNVDMSFEANEGPGPVDLKISRGMDKTVIEIKLSSNDDYLHGYEEQIEKYAKAEETNKRIFVYVKVGNPIRDKKIEKRHKERIDAGENPPFLYIIDSQRQSSASKR